MHSPHSLAQHSKPFNGPSPTCRCFFLSVALLELIYLQKKRGILFPNPAPVCSGNPCSAVKAPDYILSYVTISHLVLSKGTQQSFLPSLGPQH